jgi:ribosome maturation factor RimP
MFHASIEEKLIAIAKKAADDSSAELVHLEIAGTKRNPVVRVFIDKQGGVTIEDCSIVSRAIEDAMDAADFIPGPYVLEVSSPGLDRELYSLADFEKFTGSLAKVKMKPDFDGPRSLNGRITGVEDNVIKFDDRTAGRLTIPYASVAKANLKVDLQEEFNRG